MIYLLIALIVLAMASLFTLFKIYLWLKSNKIADMIADGNHSVIFCLSGMFLLSSGDRFTKNEKGYMLEKANNWHA